MLVGIFDCAALVLIMTITIKRIRKKAGNIYSRFFYALHKQFLFRQIIPALR